MANATYLLEMVIGGKTDASFNRSIAGATYGINNIANFTSKATKAITGGLAAAGAATIAFVASAQQTYKEFESAMANTAAIANATAQQEAAMEEAARYAGRTTTMTATQSAQALGYMALAGWSVGDSTKALLPILRLAEATQADLQTTSDLVTDSMGALGLSISDLDVYMDKLVATNNNANTTAEQLMEALIKTGGASKTMGASLDDTITAIGVLASAGYKAEEAGTAMNALLLRIGANPEAAKGLDQIGVSIYDANGNFIGLRETLIKINDAMKGLNDEERMTALRLIAGVHHGSKFQYLLDSIGTTAEETTSKWDILEEHVQNSTGALDVMNEKATDTMAAAQERLVSAWNDLKIGFTSTYGDYWKEGLDTLAQRIPEFTDRIEEFGRTHREEIRAFIKGLSDFLAGGAEKLFDLISFVVRNKEGVLGMLAGVVSGLTSINGLTKFLQIKANLALVGPEVSTLIKHFGILGLAVGGVVTAVSLIASGISNAKREAIKANLAEHFGDVALSMKECEEIARRLTFGDEYGLYKAFSTASGELERLQDALDGVTTRLDKYDWQIKIGLGLNADDEKDYKSAIDEYVDGCQNYINEHHYQLTMAYDILFGESADGAIKGMDSFYAAQLQELTSLGEQLRNAVNAGFEDGLLDINEQKKIMELQQSMETIRRSLADAQYEAKMDILSGKYGSEKLDAESFKTMIEEMGEATQEKREGLTEAKESALAALIAGRNSGYFTEAEFEAQRKTILDQYLLEDAKTSASNASWIMNGVFGAYAEAMGGDTADSLNMLIDDYTSGRVTLAEAASKFRIPEIKDKESREAIQDLLNRMKTLKEQYEETYEQFIEEGKQVPDEILEIMNSYDFLSMLANNEGVIDGEHFWNMVARAYINDPSKKEFLAAMAESGEAAPEALARALERNSGQVIGAANETREIIANIMSKPIDVATPVNVTAVTRVVNAYGEARDVFEGNGSTTGYRYAGSTSSNFLTRSTGVHDGSSETNGGYKWYGTVISNATGGIYNHEILTTAAEDGPEAIIPLDSTARARALWAEAGRRMGLIGGRDTLLADSMDAGATRTTDNSTYQVTFSPNITINGNASREEMTAAVRDTYPEFERMMERYQREQRRVSFR